MLDNIEKSYTDLICKRVLIEKKNPNKLKLITTRNKLKLVANN